MSATDPARVVVVIPALNEERAIRGVVESVLAICPNVIEKAPVATAWLLPS